MTKQEVLEKLYQFIEYLLKEKELREKLLKLKLHSNDLDVLKSRIREHDELIEEIEKNRKENILPMAEELAEFIGERHKQIVEEKAARGEEFTEEEYRNMMQKAVKEMSNDPKLKELIKKFSVTSLEV